MDTIKVKRIEARPVKQSDGSYKVITREVEVDMPNLGRHSFMCNMCQWPEYPKCRDTCANGWLDDEGKKIPH